MQQKKDFLGDLILNNVSARKTLRRNEGSLSSYICLLQMPQTGQLRNNFN